MRSALRSRNSFTRLLENVQENWTSIWKSSGETLWSALRRSSKFYPLEILIAILDGLTKLFKEIKEKEKIADLSLEYQKFAEWLRIE